MSASLMDSVKSLFFPPSIDTPIVSLSSAITLQVILGTKFTVLVDNVHPYPLIVARSPKLDAFLLKAQVLET